ncbi:MAG: RNA polymerase sigma factor [Bacteroidota bacterium]
MADDTRIGGVDDRFPATLHSVIAGVQSALSEERTRAYDRIISSYWKPVYKYIRVKWGKTNEEAKDLTQGFFLRVMEKEFFRTYNPGKARFRTFLRVCLDRFVANEAQSAARLKRGGEIQFVSLDFQSADQEFLTSEPPSPDTIEKYFEQEWVRSLFSSALVLMKEQCSVEGKDIHFSIFSRYHLADEEESSRLSYDSIAAEFGIPVTTLTNHLAYGRREFKRIVLQQLRELTATEAEFREEARSLLGVEL